MKNKGDILRNERIINETIRKNRRQYECSGVS